MALFHPALLPQELLPLAGRLLKRRNLSLYQRCRRCT
jgi:hypothetical protein